MNVGWHASIHKLTKLLTCHFRNTRSNDDLPLNQALRKCMDHTSSWITIVNHGTCCSFVNWKFVLHDMSHFSQENSLKSNTGKIYISTYFASSQVLFSTCLAIWHIPTIRRRQCVRNVTLTSKLKPRLSYWTHFHRSRMWEEYHLIDLFLSIYIDQRSLPMKCSAVCCPLWGAANHLLMQSVASRLLVR
jgi:hypothetical protein